LHAEVLTDKANKTINLFFQKILSPELPLLFKMNLSKKVSELSFEGRFNHFAPQHLVTINANALVSRQ
jgi:hypothetical protein